MPERPPANYLDWQLVAACMITERSPIIQTNRDLAIKNVEDLIDCARLSKKEKDKLLKEILDAK